MSSQCRKGIGSLAGLGLLCATATGAMAGDDVPPWDQARQFGTTSVRDRPRDGKQPDGIRIGNYLLFPELGFTSTLINDSSLKHYGKGRELQTGLSAGAKLYSQFSRHALDFELHGNLLSDNDHERFDLSGSKARMFGRIDIDHGHNLYGDASVEYRRDDDVTTELPTGAREPLRSVVARAEGGLARNVGRVSATVGARFVRHDYEDVAANDGSILDQSFRNFSQVSPFLRMAYNFSPGYRVFGEVAGIRHMQADDPALDRSADGVRVNGGVEFELTPLVKVLLSGGYLGQDYVQPGIADVQTYSYEGRVDWNVSPLLSLGFTARRNLDPTSFGNAYGRLSTMVGIRADYEMRRNLIVSAEASLREFEYLGENRVDHAWVGRVGLEYFLSRNWLLTIGYEHQDLASSVEGLDRQVDKVTVGAKFRY